jgi:hypothetical protein
MAARTDPSSGSYTIAGGELGKRRLDLLAEIMRPTTLRLLEEAGLSSGDRCLDLGCGGGSVVLDMARIVGWSAGRPANCGIAESHHGQ